jgi:hypothetical protein
MDVHLTVNKKNMQMICIFVVCNVTRNAE